MPALTIAQLYRCRWQVELFFKMDQTASSHQALLRHYRECGQDTNLDRYRGLRPGRHREKTAQHRRDALHNSTDFELGSFRENTARSHVKNMDTQMIAQQNNNQLNLFD